MDERQKTVMIRVFLLLVGILFLIILAAEGISKLGKEKIDTTEGIEIIVKAETADITAIENKIESLDAKEQTDEDEPDMRSMKEIFASSVVMGDSIALGFAEYDVLNSSSVVAEIGIKVEETDRIKAQVAMAKEMNPQVIFLCYGVNDVRDGSISVSAFLDKYKLILDYIKEEMPDTKIFVNSIFPVQQSLSAQESNLSKIEEYNAELRAVCDKKQIAFLDNTNLAESQYYEDDGMHFVSDFYIIWADRMAEVAEL